jgi:hypothetical protein
MSRALTKFLNFSHKSKHATLGSWYRYRARLLGGRLISQPLAYARGSGTDLTCSDLNRRQKNLANDLLSEDDR